MPGHGFWSTNATKSVRRGIPVLPQISICESGETLSNWESVLARSVRRCRLGRAGSFRRTSSDEGDGLRSVAACVLLQQFETTSAVVIQSGYLSCGVLDRAGESGGRSAETAGHSAAWLAVIAALGGGADHRDLDLAWSLHSIRPWAQMWEFQPSPQSSALVVTLDPGADSTNSAALIASACCRPST